MKILTAEDNMLASKPIELLSVTAGYELNPDVDGPDTTIPMVTAFLH